jgi:HmuY protein
MPASFRSFRTLLCASVALLGTACSDTTAPSGGGGATPLNLNEIVTTAPLNASALDTLVYFSFETRTLVPRSGQWDIALRRFEVRVNGGVTGTGGVTGYGFGNNKTATAAQVLGFTNVNTLAAFDLVRDAQIPVDSFFKADRLIPNANAFLNLGSGVPTANSAAYWKVKTSSGSFALVRVTGITFTGRALTAVSFEVRTQTGTTLGAPQAFTLPISSANVSVSLASLGSVIPTGCNWDLVINPALYEITPNSACNAGTYPGATTPAFAAATSASDAPSYAPYLSVLTGPVPSSIEDLAGPFRYDLLGDQRLSPSFNTYLVRNGTKTYKLQVIGYYGTAGTGGFPTLRYARIR